MSTSIVLVAPWVWHVRVDGHLLVVRAFALRLVDGVVVVVHG